uniref:Tectonic-1-3 N-terminal domain-containing protein n=1 Tax=Timema monikensis TaxID=170555 RepID=A0A7R9HSL9_9NEOP|nr:unnamed protein product [Timema monikensis]
MAKNLSQCSIKRNNTKTITNQTAQPTLREQHTTGSLCIHGDQDLELSLRRLHRYPSRPFGQIYTGSRFLCVVCDFPIHPINWSLATVKGSSPRERAYFHPAYSEVASSPCDLTENFCDISCCSDQDCSEDQKSSFTCSINKQNTDMGNITEEEILPVSFSGNPGYEVSRPLVAVMNNSLENDTSTVWKQGMVGVWSKGGICMIRPESLPESYSVHHTAVPFIIPSGIVVLSDGISESAVSNVLGSVREVISVLVPPGVIESCEAGEGFVDVSERICKRLRTDLGPQNKPVTENLRIMIVDSSSRSPSYFMRMRNVICLKMEDGKIACQANIKEYIDSACQHSSGKVRGRSGTLSKGISSLRLSNQLKMFVELTSHFTLPVFNFPGTVKVRPTVCVVLPRSPSQQANGKQALAKANMRTAVRVFRCGMGEPDVLSRFFPTQFMRSKGMFWRLYSLCSCIMVHSVLFFCIISSSLSRRFFSQSRYQRSSQSHTKGLSENNKLFGENR